MARANSLIQALRDDQAALNHAINDMWSLEWRTVSFRLSSYKFNITVGNGRLRGNETLADQLSMAILPFDIVPRYCKDAIKHYRALNGSANLSDAKILRLVYPDALVMHCYTPKSGPTKKEWFQRWGLWSTTST